jgi:hypothetical protein
MEKELEKFTTTALLGLLIEETKKFVECLENTPLRDLIEQRKYLKRIYVLLTEKEKMAKAILKWGRNSTKLVKDDPDAAQSVKITE